jgi:SPP1 family predicted phage head-tail adaptor
MDAGQLDRRIVIEQLGDTRDEFNEPVQTWTTLVEVWAGFREFSNAEAVLADAQRANVVGQFTIRYSALAATVNARHRIRYGGQVWNIRSVTEFGRKEFYRLQAVAADDLVSGA